MFLWNVGGDKPSNTQSHPRRPESSVWLLWKPQVSQVPCIFGRKNDIVPWVSAVCSFEMLEETRTQQYTVTSQKTRILCVTSVETSGLPSTLYFWKEKWHCPGLVLYVPLKCWRRQTQQHTVTSHKTRILCVTSVETSGLPSTLHFWKEKWHCALG